MVPENQQIRGPARTVFALILFLKLLAVSQGVDHIVGGSKTWTYADPPTMYDDWAKTKTFNVGDNLVFNYMRGLHNVVVLKTMEDYNACRTSSPIVTYEAGHDMWPLNKTGYHFFVCGKEKHCSLFIKLRVNVLGSNATSNGNATTEGKGSSSSSIGPIIGGAAGAVVVVLLIAAVAVWHCKRRKKPKHRAQPRNLPILPTSSIGIDGPRLFSYKELVTATKNFSRTELLGRGGFGSVHRGVLRDSSKSVIAVKSIAEDSRQGETEFLAEVSIIGKIRHRNLVRLRGWCVEKEKLLVVYDYMPNGSLDRWLIPGEGESGNPILPWKDRYSILGGVAAALAYLHEEWEQCILHRDVKPSNVLLDDKFNAYLGDFGMARLVEHNQVAYSTVVAGTMGYLAPELPHTRRATSKTDVFSFGMLALEVACGRRAFDPNRPHGEVYLLDWVWSMHQNDRLRDVTDSRLGQNVDMMQCKLVVQLGLLACHPDPESRPSMRFIRQVLHGDLSLPRLPASRPVISYSWSSVMEPLQETISVQHSASATEEDSVSFVDRTPPRPL